MGTNHKRASLAAPLAGRKNWASLPSDMVELVTNRLLDGGGIVDYLVFRAVCSGWRACTPAPHERDPGLRDLRLRPRGWVALCVDEAVCSEDAREFAMFHTPTARRLPVRLPELGGRRIVGFSDGLLALVDKTTAEIRVLSPFTRVAVGFPSLGIMYRREAIKYIRSIRSMNAAVCSTASSIVVVVWFLIAKVVVCAEAGTDHWDILYRDLDVGNALVFQGRLYATTTCSSEIVQLYPPTRRPPPQLGLPAAVAHVPNVPGIRVYHDIVLAESGGQMLVVVRNDAARAEPARDWWQQISFTIYEVDLNDNNGQWKFTPVSSLGDRALFFSNEGCLSVSARDFPSLSGNSVYFSTYFQPILVHSLTTGLSEELPESLTEMPAESFTELWKKISRKSRSSLERGMYLSWC